jgi:hypothetical protein
MSKTSAARVALTAENEDQCGAYLRNLVYDIAAFLVVEVVRRHEFVALARQ